MSKKLNEFEKKQWYKYRKPSCGNLNRCKTNELNVSPANSYGHELAKFKLFYVLRTMGHKVLTEAEETATGLRRDLVDLTNGEIYEFECEMGRAIRFIQQAVNIVPVGWKDSCEKWGLLLRESKIPKNLRKYKIYCP